MKFVLAFLILLVFFVQESNATFAKVEIYLTNTNVSIGALNLDEQDEESDVIISGTIDRLRSSALLGFHIHSLPIGDNHNCSAAGAHFNPYNTSHGMITDSISERHVGDLGNIITNADGRAYIGIADRIISLGFNQTRNVIGLPIVIHNLTDDGGHSGKGESNTTGNAGARLACGTIRAV